MFAPALLAATLVTGGAPPSWNVPITDMRDRLVAESRFITALGVNPGDFIFRLDYLTERLQHTATLPAPERADLDSQARLELKLDAELLVNRCPVFDGIAGIDESWYNDDPRAPPDPVAFYLPKADPSGRYSLVVVLHGRRQTETDVVSRATLRSLADRDHAILVAPWGTGGDLWGSDAMKEVLAIVSEMERGFPIDPRRIFLAGIREGGSSVFRVAAQYPEVFHGVLSIGGPLPPDDAFAVMPRLHNGFIYLVGQSTTYSVLADSCVPVSYYPVPSNRDGFYQAAGQIQQAWDDMFDSVIRSQNTRDCSD